MASPASNIAYNALEESAWANADQHRHTRASERKAVSRGKKAIAACMGAVTTSFLMTPFDVIKTRLQTQSPQNDAFFTARSRWTSDALRTDAESSAPRACSPRERSLRKQRAPASDHTSASPQSSKGHSMRSFTCRYDSRLDEATSSLATPSRTGKGIPRSSPPLRNLRPSASLLSHVTAPAATQHPHYLKLASTCAFPDRIVADCGLSPSESTWIRHRPHMSALLGARSSPAAHSAPLTGMWDGVIQVGRAEGARGLWRGLTPTLLMTVPSQVTYMTCYDVLRVLFLSMDPGAEVKAREASEDASGKAQAPFSSANLSTVSAHSLRSSLAAGALARSISATLVTPLEVIRTRLQASSSTSSANSFSAILRSLRRQVHEQNITILWRGLGSTLWRDVPFSALYFAGYEAMKRSVTGGGLGEGHARSNSDEFIVSFVSGAVSGSVAAIATHPFDVVKTRLQAGVPPVSRLNTPARFTSSNKARRPGTIRMLRDIYAAEGFAGLFSGLSPRVAKVAPACGIMIASFEVVGRLLAEV